MIILDVPTQVKPGTMAGGSLAGMIGIWNIGRVGHICIELLLKINSGAKYKAALNLSNLVNFMSFTTKRSTCIFFLLKNI